MQIDQQTNEDRGCKVPLMMFLSGIGAYCSRLAFLPVLILGVFYSPFVLATATEIDFKIGQVELPASALPDQTGEQYHLPLFKGKPLIVNFWASWCAPCIAELPELEALAAGFDEDDPHVILVNLDRGGQPAAQPLLEKSGIVTPLSLFDPKARWAKTLQVRGLPLTLFISADQNMYWFHTGPLHWTDTHVKSQLKKQLAF